MSKQTYTYKVANGCEIRADVYGARQGVRRPAIVWIHGGALILGAREDICPWQRELYLDAGYVVVAIDYRLAPETPLAAIVEDLQDAWRWVHRAGPEQMAIDRERIAVVGHSAGGYLALMSGYCLDPRPRALVSFYGYGDIGGAWYTQPDPYYCRLPSVSREEAYAAVGKGIISQSADHARGAHFYIYCRQHGLWPQKVSGIDPDREPAALDRFCPVRHVDAAYPPTLLLHGVDDTDVPCEQSILMAQALAQAGVSHELLTLPGAGHAFDLSDRGLQDPTTAQCFERVRSFLEQHLGAGGMRSA